MDQKLNLKSAFTRPKRSLSLIFLALVLLVFSFFGWLRLQQAIANWNFLLQLGIYPGPLYLAFGGALWGILGLFAALALWYRLTWSAIATEVSALLFAASYWIDRLVFNRSAVTQTNGFFAVGLTILGLIYSFGVSETLKRVIQ